MEHQTEEGNPLLKLRSSIITHHQHWYIQWYNKSNNQQCQVFTWHRWRWRKYKRKRKKRCKVQSACVWRGL